jgi:hypothetical protein
MSDADLIGLGLNQHLLECPHCKKQTVHKWPGSMILFASAKCIHAARIFSSRLTSRRLGFEARTCASLLVLHTRCQGPLIAGDAVSGVPAFLLYKASVKGHRQESPWHMNLCLH